MDVGAQCKASCFRSLTRGGPRSRRILCRATHLSCEVRGRFLGRPATPGLSNHALCEGSYFTLLCDGLYTRHDAQLFGCFAILWVSRTVEAGAAAQPLSIPPSQYWEGNDGHWSTVFLDVGTPAQQVRLLPGTSATAGDAIWVVLPEGCSQANPSLPEADCDEARGGLFERNSSTTWTTSRLATSRLANGGLYELDTYEESKLGLNGNAYYGFDTVSLRNGLPLLSGHLVAGFATNDFWLGSLGLSPHPINFTTLNEPFPSLLGRLWAYTAGAVYKEPPVFASVTIGGCDASRMDGEGISVPFGPDISRDLLVSLQSITFNTLGSAPLLTQGIHTFVDSLVTHPRLPLEVCQAFEAAFGLVWDETTELYLLNDTAHERLRAQNPTFTFTLSLTPDSSVGGNATTTITLPYAAFDVNVTHPFVNASQPYFPLKRAQNSAQYTLGRVFLQEAHLVADYDRGNFTIGQAAFPGHSTTDLKTILPPGFVAERKEVFLSTGAIAGIAVGVILTILLLLGLAFYLRRRSSRLRKKAATSEAARQAAEHEKKHILDEADHGVQELDRSQLYEACGSTEHSKPGELAGPETGSRSELAAGIFHPNKKDGTYLYELAGGGIAASEMEAGVDRSAT
ncbi:uncharacterized protein CLAFUR5_04614 [Fulvia fulva]|uniref:Peptidase A1 domain-containing protein n=1 Tax=Passalora fulva TaxID=5499 RepID=A0A9Q8LES6_PASFU|nr:uncharacterized protein CLAFUR5_04614 [Fulvia fulva]KAK4628573.1 hypothetical protein CLAFUR0_04643 [Fulvia fulva]UJO16221.1 hypothetical protein CLAFUR5_04614 [Fulvia fulva]WPV28113.1 hypothetical protein CLAFUW7_04647 [Fulvia fulva]